MTTINLSPFALAPGQAVLYCPRVDSWSVPLRTIPGTITRISNRVTMVCTDGTRRTVDPANLLQQGYCAACEAPAHRSADTTLICPHCGGDASAIPPRELALSWVSDRDWYWVHRNHEQYVSGSTRREAWQIVHDRIHAAWVAMLKETGLYDLWAGFGAQSDAFRTQCQRHRERLQRLAVEGHTAAFVALATDGRGVPQPPGALSADDVAYARRVGHTLGRVCTYLDRLDRADAERVLSALDCLITTNTITVLASPEIHAMRQRPA